MNICIFQQEMSTCKTIVSELSTQFLHTKYNINAWMTKKIQKYEKKKSKEKKWRGLSGLKIKTCWNIKDTTGVC